MNSIHPGFILFSTAAAVVCTRGRIRQAVLLGGTLLALIALGQLGPEARWTMGLAGYTVQLLQVDALSHVFGLIFSLITLIGALYAVHTRRAGEHAATLVYAGAALGVVFAGDWLSLFVFWELMAVASLFVVWYGGTRQAQAAGFRYLLVHICGGSLLFCGILLHLAQGHDLALHALTSTATSGAAFWLILTGIGINAAIPPLHAWLTDAYPEASVTGSVFLSAFTTKTAVYVLVRLFPGAEILVWAGIVMTLYGVVYAILEKDIRRLLAYHIVSQVGYMVTGVGIGTALALNGTVAHAFSHILYKALLFMGAGAVIQATGRRKLTELGGLGQSLPLVAILYMVGAFSISGVPLFNGFISKSMVISAAAEAHRPLAELLLSLASVGTFLSVGLKLPYFTFAGRSRGIPCRSLPHNMLLAMGVSAVLCLGSGLFPGLLYNRLPFSATYHPYTLAHLISTLQLLAGTGLGFWLYRTKLLGKPAITLDTDWWYRRLLPQAAHGLITMARQGGCTLERLRQHLLQAMVPYFQNPFLILAKASSRISLSGAAWYDEDHQRLPIGLTVFWIVLFFVCIAVYSAVAG